MNIYQLAEPVERTIAQYASWEPPEGLMGRYDEEPRGSWQRLESPPSAINCAETLAPKATLAPGATSSQQVLVFNVHLRL